MNFWKRKNLSYLKNQPGNYPISQFSIASSLNMEYLSDLSNSVGKDSKSYLPIIQMVYNSQVIKNFKSLGYEIVIFDSELCIVC